MLPAGTVVRAAQGLAIARAPDDEHPPIGAETVDERLDTVGTVVDVFGPVERPYLAIDPEGDRHLPELLGEKLYVR